MCWGEAVHLALLYVDCANSGQTPHRTSEWQSKEVTQKAGGGNLYAKL